MSANNQLLVKEHKGKFYIFDVMAESWDDTNILDIKEARGVFPTREEAHRFAHSTESSETLPSEYGVVDEILCKDGTEVIIKEGNHE